MSFTDDRRERKKREVAIDAMLEQAKAAADAREPKVNALYAWLTSRRISNGIGLDFEWDLANPRRSGRT